MDCYANCLIIRKSALQSAAGGMAFSWNPLDCQRGCLARRWQLLIARTRRDFSKGFINLRWRRRTGTWGGKFSAPIPLQMKTPEHFFLTSRFQISENTIPLSNQTLLHGPQSLTAGVRAASHAGLAAPHGFPPPPRGRPPRPRGGAAGFNGWSRARTDFFSV